MFTDLVREFVAARDARRAHRPPSESRPLTLDEAYRCQDRAGDTVCAACTRLGAVAVRFV